MRPLIALLALLPLALLAGCLDQGAATLEDAAAALDAAAQEEAATLRAIPVSHEGATPTGACVSTPVLPCTGPVHASTESAWEARADGVLDEVELTLTWDALSPATAELLVGVGYEVGGEWTWEYEVGASPLTLSRTGLGIPDGAKVWIYANAYRCQGAESVYLCATTEQPFRLEGSLGVVG